MAKHIRAGSPRKKIRFTILKILNIAFISFEGFLTKNSEEIQCLCRGLCIHTINEINFQFMYSSMPEKEHSKCWHNSSPWWMIHGKIFGFPFRLFGILHENQNACLVYYARHSLLRIYTCTFIFYVFFLGKHFAYFT